MAPTPLARLVRPRHLLATLLVGLLLGGAAIGIVSAGQGTPSAEVADESPADLDVPFGVPVPRVGDHAVYRLNWTNDDNSQGYWPQTLEFQWLEDAEGYNGTAARIVVNRLMVRQTGMEPRPDELLYLIPGTSRSVSSPHTYNDTQTTEGAPPLFPGMTYTNHGEYFAFDERETTLACGIRNALQGNSIDLGSGFDDDVPCFNGPGSWATDDYHAATEEAHGPLGQRVVRFVESMHGSSPILEWVYREDIPYPLAITYRSGHGTSYVLEAFTQGSVPITTSPAVLAPSPPAIEMAPRTFVGPDETGFPHPFPLSQAVEQARLLDSTIAAFMAQHPDAYVGAAGYQEMVSGPFVDRGWVFVLTDGKDAIGRFIDNKYLVDPAGLPPFTSSVRDASNWVEDTDWPAPKDAPRAMPTLRSLVKTWSVMEGSGEPGYHVYFGMGCRPDPCKTDAVPYVLFGRTVDVSNHTLPTDSWDRSIEGSYISVYGEELSGFHRSVQTQSEGTAFAPDVASMPAFGLARPLTKLSLSPGAAGAGAVLGVLLYWLWPALKAGPAALFSRVREEDVLKNKVRAEIHQRIEAEPGIHHQALVRAIGRGHGTVEHHMRKLLDAGLVSRVQGKGYTCYFPKGRVAYREMTAAPLLKSPVAKSILDQVRERPGIRSSELARSLAVAPATIHYHVERMRNAGLIEGSLAAGALRLRVPG